MHNSSISSLYTNMGRMDKLFYQMNTLKKIQRPSDDPIVAGRSMKLKLNIMESEQHKTNVDEANAWMSVTEAALDNSIDIIKSIREKATYAANGTHTKEDRQKIADEITQLYEQLKQESNVTYAGRYVFSGYKTDEPVSYEKDTTLDADVAVKKDLAVNGATTIGAGSTLAAGTVFKAGTVFAEDTDIEGVTYLAGEALTTDVTLTSDMTLASDMAVEGKVVLKEGTNLAGGKDADGNPTGTTLPKGTLNPKVLGGIEGQEMLYEIGVNTTIGVNITEMPDMMYNLVQNIEEMMGMLENPDVTDEELNALFGNMIEEMDSRLSEASQMQSELGSKQNRLIYTEKRLTDDNANLTELLSNTEDVDLEEVYVAFNTQYAVYQSALQATSKIVMNTLADFLR